MARKLRIQFPNALYLITNRGDRHQPIALDDTDRQAFFHTLEEAVHKTHWQIHAVTLLPNHFHMLLRTPTENLVEGMKWFLATYTGRFNRRHHSPGHLFAGRYRSQVLDPSQSQLITDASDYIHLNPLRLRQGALAEDQLSQYEWSSLPDYLSNAPSPRWPWLAREEALASMALDSSADPARQIQNRIQPIVERGGVEARWDIFRRGWCAGSPPFRQFLLDQLNRQRDDKVSGAAWQEAAALTAERRVQQLLSQSGWSEESLAQTPKSHPDKIRIAQVLREETTMTLHWITHRLNMGSVYTLRNVLAVHRAHLKGAPIESARKPNRFTQPSLDRAATARFAPSPSLSAPWKGVERKEEQSRAVRTLVQTAALIASNADQNARAWALPPQGAESKPQDTTSNLPSDPTPLSAEAGHSAASVQFDPGWD